MARTVEKGRSAETGQFVPIDYAKKHPKTTVVEKKAILWKFYIIFMNGHG